MPYKLLRLLLEKEDRYTTIGEQFLTIECEAQMIVIAKFKEMVPVWLSIHLV
jgi:uncharacterized protein YfbU (UPF0304 family)